MKKLFPVLVLCFLCNCTIAQLTYSVVSSGLNAASFETGSSISELEVGDIDGDGDLDIVTIGDHGSPNIGGSENGIMVYKNNGSGTSWSLVEVGSFGYGGVALGDVNNDGKIDIGYGMHHNYSSTDFGDQLLEVALGDGSGSSWTPYDDGLAGTTEGQSYGMFGTDFGDINNDGLLDIASNAMSCCDGIWIYKNDGNGHWTKADGFLGGNSNKECQLGDFNNDGNIDMASANDWGQLWKNDGTGTITPMQTGIPHAPFMNFDIGDVNNDGGKDIAIVAGNGVLVYTYNKTLLAWESISNGLPTSGVFRAALADMDMDGKCDLISFGLNAITIYKGDGAGNWVPNGTLPPSYGISSIATGDFDHDGYTDFAILATPNTGSTRLLRIYLHTVANPVLNILPENPKGYECFVQGSVQFINWLSSVPAGPLATVMIEFSSTGTGGPWTTVVASVPNSGIYQWAVPNVNSPNCYLKFTISQGSSVQSVTTSNPFGIGSCATPPPTAVYELNNETNNLIAFPNPVSRMGYVQFTLNKATFTEIKLFDMLGKEIQLILNEQLNAGDHKIQFSSSALTDGIYFMEVLTGGKTMQTKLVVMNKNSN